MSVKVKSVFGILLIFAFVVCMFGAVEVDAADGNSAADVAIWEGPDSFHVMYNGIQRTLTLTEHVYNYLITMETYEDADGEDVTIIFFNLAFASPIAGGYNGLQLRTNFSDSSLYDIYIYSPNSYSDSKYRARAYYVTIKNGVLSDFVYARTGSLGSPSNASLSTGQLQDDSSYAARSGYIYKTPFYQDKYTIYCTLPVEDYNSGELLYPVTPLSAVPPLGGEGGYPYWVTFRMLNGEVTVYNTYYYTSSYMSSADEISASGNICLDAIKFSDGTVTRTTLSAPQLLCQISSYGTAYDIVSTNDDNLLSLLGISKPAEQYWDVAAQEWKPVSSGGSGTGSSGSGNGSSNIDSSLLVSDTTSLSPIKNLTVKLVGDDALIDAITFNDYYAGQVFHSNKLDDLNTPVWGLGNYLTWDYDGIKYETTGNDSGPGGLLNATANHRRIKLVVKAKFRIDANTIKTLTYTLYDYDNAQGIAIGTGSRKISFYDLCLYFQSAYPEYITDFPTQLQQVSYYLTPFYYDTAEGKYHYGSTSQVTQNIKSALADYSGGEWDGDDGGWSNVGDVSDFEWIWQDISSGIGNIAAFIKNMLSSGKGIFASMGQIPQMIGDLFSFIPSEIVTVIGIGLGLWLLPSLLGLAKQAMEAVGNVAVAAGGTIAKIIQAIVKAI